MKRFADYLKGFLIGLANVIAGLSGGTVAVILNAYNDLLDVFSNIATHLISTIKKHYKLLIGILLGLVIGAFALKKLYEIIPLSITGFFAGMVCFSLIPLFKKLDFKNHTVLKIFLCLISFIFLITLSILQNGENVGLSVNAKDLFITMLLGFIAAIAMILPGVSGSMILLVLGYYTDVLSIVTECIKFKNLSTNILLVLFLIIGVGIGLVFGSKVIKKLINNYKSQMDFLIYGLIFGSTIGMVVSGTKAHIEILNNNNYSSAYNISMIISSVILFVIGFVVAYIVEKKLNSTGGSKMKELKMDDFLKYSDEYFEEFVSELTKLVSFKSVLEKYDETSGAPFGEENVKALEYMLNLGEKDGFNTLNSDNYAGHIEFGEGEEILGLLAHLDVVPVSGQVWDNDPFTVVRKDGKLIGRGVNDDKGPLLASYIAIKMLKNLGFKPNKKIRLIMGCDEESGSRCLEHYFKYNEMPTIGFSPDACFPCINGEKAHAHIDVLGKDSSDSIIETFDCGERYNIVPAEAHMTLKKDLSKEYLEFLNKHNYKGEFKDNTYYAYGLGAHAMTPEKGVNASFILFEFLNEYSNSNLVKFMNEYITFDPFGSKLSINKEYDELGKLTLNVGVVKISNNNVLVGFDLRVPADEMEKDIRDSFTKALENTELYFEMPRMTPVHYVSKDSFLVKALVKSYQEATGDYEHTAYSIGGGTYAKFMPSAVAFGPQFIGREDVDHQANEYIYESDYKKIIAIYAKSIYDLTR